MSRTPLFALVDLWDDSFILDKQRDHYSTMGDRKLENLLNNHPLWDTFLANLMVISGPSGTYEDGDNCRRQSPQRQRHQTPNHLHRRGPPLRTLQGGHPGLSARVSGRDISR